MWLWARTLLSLLPVHCTGNMFRQLGKNVPRTRLPSPNFVPGRQKLRPRLRFASSGHGVPSFSDRKKSCAKEPWLLFGRNASVNAYKLYCWFVSIQVWLRRHGGQFTHSLTVSLPKQMARNANKKSKIPPDIQDSKYCVILIIADSLNNLGVITWIKYKYRLW